MKRTVLSSGTFARTSKRFVKKHPELVDALEKALRMLADDPFDARLQTHKLRGDLADCWSCGFGYDARIVFRFVKHDDADAVQLLSVGTHDEVY